MAAYMRNPNLEVVRLATDLARRVFRNSHTVKHDCDPFPNADTIRLMIYRHMRGKASGSTFKIDLDPEIKSFLQMTTLSRSEDHYTNCIVDFVNAISFKLDEATKSPRGKFSLEAADRLIRIRRA